MPLFLLFVAMPIIEIALLIEVGERIGGWSTIGLVILTAVIGAFLVRQQGLATLLQARQKMDQGQIPGQEMLEGLMLAVAGVLLVTPGFVTDTFGLLLVLPLTRPVIARWLMKRVKVVSPGQGHGQFRYRETRQDGSGSTIEGEYEIKNGESKSNDRLPPER